MINSNYQINNIMGKICNYKKEKEFQFISLLPDNNCDKCVQLRVKEFFKIIGNKYFRIIFPSYRVLIIKKL